MDQRAARLLLIHGPISHGWIDAVRERLDKHSVHTITVASGKEAPVIGLEEIDLARFQVCSVCVDADSSLDWLRKLLDRIRRDGGSMRVFPVLLPGATAGLVAEFWPQWDWIDFRESKSHEVNFQRMLGAILGERPFTPLSVDNERAAPPRLSEYERRIRRLERFLSIGLREEVYIEVQRKIITKWMDDPHWEDS